ncbi:hypothetical protein [Streptomyces sp. AC495_CC817]|uniref:hypothetical protein n=1 Tax=Streptomyces sp. AC495_CC817 TaxID=2823900 RepID=UPI001C26AF8E|nr:hypothetical protein [Streptomyces sp. AC495_CC817]
MGKTTRSVKSDGWSLFDRVVADAKLRGSSPWVVNAGVVRYSPDFDTLELLLRVPWVLGSTSTSGLPALALDVWIAYELRRAGFDPDAVWPRADTPRILPGSIATLLDNLNKADAARLRELLTSGKTFGGTVGSNARILGKNYMKQVDVVISDWDTGPELLISTKRMDDSFGNNAPNRIEESYGDAKNLRSRHPRSALGFAFSLNANAFAEAPRVADWILDLLAKLGREDDAYDAVALIVPRFPGPGPCSTRGQRTLESVHDEALIEAELIAPPVQEAVPTTGSRSGALLDRLVSAPSVELLHDHVPDELAPARFLEHMIRHVLDNSPITRHRSARDLLTEIESKPYRELRRT